MSKAVETLKPGEMISVNTYSDGTVESVESVPLAEDSGLQTDGKMLPGRVLTRVHYVRYQPGVERPIRSYKDFAPGAQVSYSVDGYNWL